ncbi:MAG: hypothetical protein ACREV5_01490 [Steroidobacter sp.]
MTAGSNFVGDESDFDFLIGSWNVVNRRLKTHWVGGDEWDEFPATSELETRLNRVVNIDEFIARARGFSGMSLRILDQKTRQWAIYWINSKTGVLFPPVYGGFNGDRGEFYGADMDDGRPVRVRFIWTKQGANNARWEQAFSLDGETWETNWIMEFTRVKD